MDSPLAHLVDQIRSAAASATALRIRGGGSKDFYGQTLQGEILDTRPLHGIVRLLRATAQRLGDRQLVALAVLVAATATASLEVLEAVEAVVARDAVDPRGQLRVGAKLLHVLVHGDEDLLREVECFFAISQHPHAEVIDAVLVRLHQCLEGGGILATKTRDQQVLGQLARRRARLDHHHLRWELQHVARHVCLPPVIVVTHIERSDETLDTSESRGFLIRRYCVPAYLRT